MANKFLTLAGLKAATNKTSPKGFSQTILVFDALERALKAFEAVDEGDMNERRDALDKVIDAADESKKMKMAKGEKDVLKYFDDVLKAAKAERKKIETDLVKYGMQKISKLTVFMLDWKDKGVPMENRQVQIVFECPRKPKVVLKGQISRGAVRFSDLELPPDGSIYIKAFANQGASDQATGSHPYDLKKKQSVSFMAKQAYNSIKEKAGNSKEAVKKAGVKGTAGIDFSIKGIGFKLGKDESKDKEEKTSESKEREYEILEPMARLDIEMVK